MVQSHSVEASSYHVTLKSHPEQSVRGSSGDAEDFPRMQLSMVNRVAALDTEYSGYSGYFGYSG